MRGQHSLCLFCRILTPTNFFSRAYRSSAYRAPRFTINQPREPYVLSRLVIDLDAADSKYVKRLEDSEYKDEDAQEDRSTEKEHSPSPEFPLESPSPEQGLEELHVRPHDLLHYAFLGDISPTNLRNFEAHHVHRENDVFPMDKLGTKIEQMLYRFSRNRSRNLKLAGFHYDDRSQIAEQLKNYSIFWRLRRAVTLLSSTREGCKFLTKQECLLRQAFNLCLQMQDGEYMSWERVTNEKLLFLLNNLSVNLRSKGLVLGAPLCKTGYSVAESLGNVSSMKLYAEIINEFFENILHPQHGMSLGRSLKHLAVRDEVIALEIKKHYLEANEKSLTGDIEKETLTLAISDEIQRDYVDYPMYLCVLGSLGLKEQLWSEWTASVEQGEFLQIKGNELARQLRAQMFATAFVLAKDPDKALAALNSVPESERSDIRDVGNEILPLGESIRQLVSECSEAPSVRFRMYIFIQCYYACHNLAMGSKLQRAVWHVLGNMPADAREALGVIEKYLPTTSLGRPAPQTPFKFKGKVDWVELNGSLGLLVSGLSDIEIYWKAAYETVEIPHLDSSPDVS